MVRCSYGADSARNATTAPDVRFGVLPTSPLLSSVIGIEEGGISLIIGTINPKPKPC